MTKPTAPDTHTPAPQDTKPWWDHWRPESDYAEAEKHPAAAPGESSSSTAAKIRELESALRAAREERDRLKEALAAMTEDRNLWRDEHDEDCPNKAMFLAERESRKQEAVWNRAKDVEPEDNQVCHILGNEMILLNIPYKKGHGWLNILATPEAGALYTVEGGVVAWTVAGSFPLPPDEWFD